MNRPPSCTEPPHHWLILHEEPLGSEKRASHNYIGVEVHQRCKKCGVIWVQETWRPCYAGRPVPPSRAARVVQ